MKKRLKKCVAVLVCAVVLMSAMTGTVLAAKKTKASDKKIYKAYKSKINALKEESDFDEIFWGQYWLYDVTGDDVDELIVDTGGGEMARRIIYYTYKNGKTKKIGETSGWHSEMGINKKGKLIRYVWDYGGCYAYKVSYKKKIKEKRIFEYYGDGDDFKKKLKKAGLSEKRLPYNRIDDLSLLKKHFPKH